MRVAFILVVIVLPNYDYRQPRSWIVIEFQRFYFHKWFTSGGKFLHEVKKRHRINHKNHAAMLEIYLMWAKTVLKLRKFDNFYAIFICILCISRHYSFEQLLFTAKR